MNFLKRLTEPRPILLDGATGSELDRRAVNVTLPLWSARAILDAPDVLFQIHTDYLRAGAEIITANTFRTHRRSLAKGGMGGRARELTRRAVEIARRAVMEFPQPADGAVIERFVAGSAAPLEDCYSPELVPPQPEVEAEHAEMAGHLAEAGVDVILVETMNTIREAAAATQAARATGLPVLASFVCRSDGRLFSGESVAEAVNAIAPLGPVGLLVNCTPTPTIAEPFTELYSALEPFRTHGLPLAGLYGNIGHTNDVTGWTNTTDVTPLEYAQLAAGWLKLGARIVGGCCGTTPGHIAALKMVMI
jgi:homocysteine S-methyltransferase